MQRKPFPITQIARIPSNNTPVHAVTFSAGTGQYILTGSQDRTVRLYNPNTRRQIQAYNAHGYEVLDLAVSEDNARFVSVGGDKTVFLWDVATATTLRRFNGHAGRVNACSFGGEGDSVIVSGSFDGTVRVWDAKSRDSRPVMTLSEAKDSVSSVAVRGGEIFTGSVDGRVRVYDLAMGDVSVDVIAPGKGCTSVQPTKAGDGYVVSSLDSKVRFMDRGSGKCLQSFGDEGFKNEEYRVRSTLAMADASVISGSEDGKVFVWDVLTGEMLHRLWHKDQGAGGGAVAKSSKRDVVSAVAWNQLRKQWASAGGDGTVVVWGLEQ
ncbi:related to S.pombe beta-transducin [Ramularia collo-cygni]|uniref:Related to S.pombe beta-transducin n=1 Tax=Ramularia collo-cygni TaxID=112498 RepID=A0A2D3VIS5_9PEZI|nr:related to S.pombe beta-transducin [Ramularia collo-cygni]CZT21939.1 related to S.pombe beta-transducin [Ramularia collo-cygni]